MQWFPGTTTAADQSNQDMVRFSLFAQLYVSALVLVTAVAALRWLAVPFPILPIVVPESVPQEAPQAVHYQLDDAALPLTSHNALPLTGNNQGHGVPQRQTVLGYDRQLFGGGWAPDGACDMRDSTMRAQMLTDTPHGNNNCTPRGRMYDPYSNRSLDLDAGEKVEVDHVLPLSAAWDLGAYNWDESTRRRFANDPRNLVATSRENNQDKSDQLPSEWMPPHRPARCWYARRLAAVADAYHLALPEPDIRAMNRACRWRISAPEWLGW